MMKILTDITLGLFSVTEYVGALSITDPSGIPLSISGGVADIPFIIDKIKAGVYVFKDNSGTTNLDVQEREFDFGINYEVVGGDLLFTTELKNGKRGSTTWFINERQYDKSFAQVQAEDEMTALAITVVSWKTGLHTFTKTLTAELLIKPVITPVADKSYFINPDFYKSILHYLSNKTGQDFGFKVKGSTSFPYKKPGEFVKIEGCGVTLEDGVFNIDIKDYEFKVAPNEFVAASTVTDKCKKTTTYNVNFDALTEAVETYFEENYLEVLEILGDEMTDRCLGISPGDNYAQKVQKLIQKICRCCNDGPTVVGCRNTQVSLEYLVDQSYYPYGGRPIGVIDEDDVPVEGQVQLVVYDSGRVLGSVVVEIDGLILQKIVSDLYYSVTYNLGGFIVTIYNMVDGNNIGLELGQTVTIRYLKN